MPRETKAPTLDEIRQWPATVDVPTGGAAFGMPRSTAYEAVKTGQFPARVLKVGGRYRVVTASIVRALSEEEAAA
ncbi:hypothetical protein [Saccharopolyspora spinosa]|nr:hypothetical protein [Saccharopolyspora spinosa]